MTSASRSLLAAVVFAALAACSASGTSGRAGGQGGAAGAAGAGGSAGTGGDAGSGGAGGEDASIGDDGSAGAGGAAGSGGASGGGAGGGGGAAGVGGAGGSGAGGPTGPWDFGQGWVPEDQGRNPPLVGTGGTTVETGPGADSGSPGKFGGAQDPAAGVTVVYPPDGVVVPPNLNSLEIHFVPAPGQTLFEIAFHAPTQSYVVYTGCTRVGAGCVWSTSTGFWQGLVPYARGAAPVSFTVRGVNGASPGGVGTSGARSIGFAEQDITGGIYYWNTAGFVQRYDFGKPSLPPEIYMTQANAGGIFCVGCHVMSRDGDAILVGKDFPAPAPYAIFDVATKKPLIAGGNTVTGGANFATFSPDAKHVLTSDGVSIAWRELYTGTFVSQVLVPSGTMPDWSPDGRHFVYAKGSGSFLPVPGVESASLETLQFNGAGWDTPRTLVPFGGANDYYPAYAPTGDWVVFDRSPANHNSFSNATDDADAGTTADGELWVVAADGGTPVRLDRASNPGPCSWPKWAPVVDDYFDGKILWLTFSSYRSYGLRLADKQRTQLWMVGFDPQRAAAGLDPSLPAFWLPFQDIGGGNHIAQWTTKVVRRPCTSDLECDASEKCEDNHCYPR